MSKRFWRDFWDDTCKELITGARLGYSLVIIGVIFIFLGLLYEPLEIVGFIVVFIGFIILFLIGLWS